MQPIIPMGFCFYKYGRKHNKEREEMLNAKSITGRVLGKTPPGAGAPGRVGYNREADTLFSDSRRFFCGCFVIMMAVIQTGVLIRYRGCLCLLKDFPKN